MVFDGLTSTFDGLHMVEQASLVVARARHLARGAGRVGLPLAPAGGRGPGRRSLRRRDRRRSATSPPTRAIRRDTTLEKLASLQPVFDPEGTTTAGNAPGVNDGASCVVVCSEEFAARRGLEPLATILAQGYVADDFAYLARTPARAARRRSRRRARRSTTSRASRSTRRSRRSRRTRRACSASTRRSSTSTAARSRSATRSARPAGASSATMVHELRRSGGGLGLAAICSGGGQGDALLIEV